MQNKEEVYYDVRISVDLPDDKLVFFHKGDLVKHKRLIETSPVMLVDRVLFKTDNRGNYEMDSANKKILSGIQCSWFNRELNYVSHVFNSKDLMIVDNVIKTIDEYEG